jgi:hypothetical protein
MAMEAKKKDRRERARRRRHDQPAIVRGESGAGCMRQGGASCESDARAKACHTENIDIEGWERRFAASNYLTIDTLSLSFSAIALRW